MLFKSLLISALVLGTLSYPAPPGNDGCDCGRCACDCSCDCSPADPTTTTTTTTTTAEAPPVMDEPCCCCCCCELQEDPSTTIYNSTTTTTTLPPPSSPSCGSCCGCRRRRQAPDQVEAASQNPPDDEVDPVPIPFNDADRHQYRRMDTNAAQNCPAGFKRSGNACFYVETKKLNFSTAVAKCNEKGATIFSPTSLEQWREVTAMTPTFFWTWIGIEQHEDAEKPRFKGPDAMDASKLNWFVKPYKPAVNGWVAWAHCAAFYHAGTSDWNYVYFYPCTWHYHSICQKNF
ncbi:unnamed protein product [Heligmosomoides polygyrus]|uniref:C-type lectin domain-containing protein n=1 Tax=Heligmosomoides polygyrus TaxID=6339 RepID=A0A183FPB9_HELPZ|nr:unnamed protein product [Heligmosomoides polygyrus]